MNSMTRQEGTSVEIVEMRLKSPWYLSGTIGVTMCKQCLNSVSTMLEEECSAYAGTMLEP